VAILVDTTGKKDTDNTWVIILASILSVVAVAGILGIIVATIVVAILLKKAGNRLWIRRYHRSSSGAVAFPETEEEYEIIKKSSSSDEGNITNSTYDDPNSIEMEELQPLEETPPVSNRDETPS